MGSAPLPTDVTLQSTAKSPEEEPYSNSNCNCKSLAHLCFPLIRFDYNLRGIFPFLLLLLRQAKSGNHLHLPFFLQFPPSRPPPNSQRLETPK